LGGCEKYSTIEFGRTATIEESWLAGKNCPDQDGLFGVSFLFVFPSYENYKHRRYINGINSCWRSSAGG
jgi:hypothetical protein